MCIKIKCRACGDVFASTSIARVVCDKPGCRGFSRHPARTKVIPCAECGKPVPVGSRRRKYCSPKCAGVK